MFLTNLQIISAVSKIWQSVSQVESRLWNLWPENRVARISGQNILLFGNRKSIIYINLFNSFVAIMKTTSNLPHHSPSNHSVLVIVIPRHRTAWAPAAHHGYIFKTERIIDAVVYASEKNTSDANWTANNACIQVTWCIQQQLWKTCSTKCLRKRRLKFTARTHRRTYQCTRGPIGAYTSVLMASCKLQDVQVVWCLIGSEVHLASLPTPPCSAIPISSYLCLINCDRKRSNGPICHIPISIMFRRPSVSLGEMWKIGWNM